MTSEVSFTYSSSSAANAGGGVSGKSDERDSVAVVTEERDKKWRREGCWWLWCGRGEGGGAAEVGRRGWSLGVGVGSVGEAMVFGGEREILVFGACKGEVVSATWGYHLI